MIDPFVTSKIPDENRYFDPESWLAGTKVSAMFRQNG